MKRLLFACAALLLACGPSEDEIKAEIAEANYCEVADDCALISGKCPFGCYVLINEREVERIESLIDDFESYCDNDCNEPPAALACEQSRCVGVDQP